MFSTTCAPTLRCDALLKPSSAVSEFAVYFADGKLHGVNGNKGEGGGDEKGNEGNVWEMQFIAGYNERINDGKVGRKSDARLTSKLNEDVSENSDAMNNPIQSAYGDVSDEGERMAGIQSQSMASEDEENEDRDKADKRWVPFEVSSADLLSDSKVGLHKMTAGLRPAFLAFRISFIYTLYKTSNLM